MSGRSREGIAGLGVRDVVEITDPLGPGLEMGAGAGGAPIATRARWGGPFPGLDRGELLDSDDGTGRAVRVLVALPTSSWRGCRIAVRWDGAVADERGEVLVGGIEGCPPATPEAVHAAAGTPTRRQGSALEAARVARDARRRFRERRAARRIVGGRAWGMPATSLEAARFATPHAKSAYSLARLTPRLVRALELLLDPDERVLYAVERPAGSVASWRRLGRPDRRAAILLLTDREVVWAADRADPDVYLSDPGLDVVCVPSERLLGVTAVPSRAGIGLSVKTAAGRDVHMLPAELEPECTLFARLAARFTADRLLPRRVYAKPTDSVDWGRMDAFGEAEAVRALALSVSPSPLAVVPSPARPGHPRTRALVLDHNGVALADPAGCERAQLTGIHSVGLVISAREGRVEIVGRHPLRLDVPAPYADVAARFARVLRRRLACTPDAPGPAASGQSMALATREGPTV